MKTIYQFTLKEKILEDTQIKSKDEAGNEVVTIKKQEVEKERKFAIKKPTRSLEDSARLYYSKEYSHAVRNDVIPAALLEKRFNNDKGVLSDEGKSRLQSLYKDLTDKQEKLDKLTLIEKDKRTEEQTKEMESLLFDIAKISQELQDYEQSVNSLYNQTAENYAKEKLIFWWILQLAYSINEKGEFVAFYGEDDYDKKAEKYDSIEEDDNKFQKEASKYLTFLIAYWFSVRAFGEIKPVDFDRVKNIFEAQQKANGENSKK